MEARHNAQQFYDMFTRRVFNSMAQICGGVMISVLGGGHFRGSKSASHLYIFAARKLNSGQGNVFICVCHSVGGVSMMSLPVLLSGPIFLLGVSVPGPMFLPGGGSLSRGAL